MPKSQEVPVTPAVLGWARSTAGLEVEQVARALRVAPSEVLAWERGTFRPTLHALERLASKYRRPMAVFFLPSPPEEPPPPGDYRTLPEASRGPLSPRLRLAIRRAHWLRSKAEAISRDRGEADPTRRPAWPRQESPERVAERERRSLGVQLETQFAWTSAHEAFREWRARIEARGILVFEFAFPVGEARAFSIQADRHPAVVVNSSDAVAARIFTLFHEFAHLGIGSPGLCLPEEGTSRLLEPAERFCNAFAGALLVPRDALRESWEASAPREGERGDEERALSLARLFRVSRDVILRRALDSGILPRGSFDALHGRWREERSRRPAARGGFREPPTKRCVSERGRAFVSLVLDALDREAITGRDAVDLLGVKAEQLDAVPPLAHCTRR